jgi:hypothetical protein
MRGDTFIASKQVTFSRRYNSIIWRMSVSTIKMTARQFLELGEDPPGVRLELVDGEVAVSPSPVPRHSFTLLRLSNLFGQLHRFA